MKKLTTTSSPQTIRFIPREFAETVTMQLRDDSTNSVTSYDLGSKVWNAVSNAWNGASFQWESESSVQTVGDYMELTANFSLTEGRFYDMTVKSGGDVIYKDKIFCTDQIVDQDTERYYSVNAVPTEGDSPVWNLSELSWGTFLNWDVAEYQPYEYVGSNDYIIL
jgi:hypothetical protein